MLIKSVCKNCFKLHGKAWNDKEWESGYITCPTDTVSVFYKGTIVSLDNNDPLKKLLSNVFGTIKTSDNIPYYCPFDSIHISVN